MTIKTFVDFSPEDSRLIEKYAMDGRSAYVKVCLITGKITVEQTYDHGVAMPYDTDAEILSIPVTDAFCLESVLKHVIAPLVTLIMPALIKKNEEDFGHDDPDEFSAGEIGVAVAIRHILGTLPLLENRIEFTESYLDRD